MKKIFLNILKVLLIILMISSLSVYNTKIDDNNEQIIEVISIESTITQDKKYGGMITNLEEKDMLEAGFEYGDECKVVLSNGYVIESIPYYSGYFGRTGEDVLVNYAGNDKVKAQTCQGDSLWVKANCKEGDTITITLVNKGTYKDIEDALSMAYTNNREDYESDEVFGNFRVLKGGNLKDNMFYRGATPINPKYNRNSYVDSLLEEYQINFVLDLEDNEDLINEYLSNGDYTDSYDISLYDNGKVCLAKIGSDYYSDNTKKIIAEGLVELSNNEGPYYIHCAEGKDRTGVVCAIIECIGGYSIDEMLEDYMITYNNYYGVTANDVSKYNAILDVDFYDMLENIAKVDSKEELEKINLEEAAKQYLIEGGMSETEYNHLKEVIVK